MILGGAHLLNRTRPQRPDELIVLVGVPPQEVCRPATSVVVRWDVLGLCMARALRPGGAQTGSAWIDGGELSPDAIPGPILRRLAGAEAAPSLVPLCYLAEHPDGGYHAYAQVRFHPEDACFVRTTRAPVGHGPVEGLHWLAPVLATHAELSMALDNHLRYFRRHFEGTELEYKYILDPAPDIWVASMELLNALRDGELAGFQPEYREEFEVHHTENHLFDVIAPEHEAGYASFIPTVTTGHVLKRKWFTKDTFARREELTPGLDISPDRFEAHLSEELGLHVRAMPPFRRVRYDVQCASMRTGHIYGLFFDRCSLLAAPEIALTQCELEYLRSRSVLDQDHEVLSEMERLNGWLGTYLANRGWAKNHTFYSKRTFLRDAIAARPDLLPSSRAGTPTG
ncbi:hypothetical protein [Actinomadura harenae]|uniref:hypothetical protein n=1 Tax=Actinomadura harenae TaxID=2483351 RepID=UPI001F189136|nr:hypothetical protein [Actinomadura harenae]